LLLLYWSIFRLNIMTFPFWMFFHCTLQTNYQENTRILNEVSKMAWGAIESHCYFRHLPLGMEELCYSNYEKPEEAPCCLWKRYTFICMQLFLFHLCVCLRRTAGDRGTGARVRNENESLRISISPARAILSILWIVHHQLTPITKSKADSQPQIYSQAATMCPFSSGNVSILHCCWNSPTSCDLLFVFLCQPLY